MSHLLVYGAAGYTGRMICEHVKKLGIDFTIAGATESKLQQLSLSLHVPYIVFGLGDAATVDRSLAGFNVLLNCAGPFAKTAAPLVAACIRSRTHYLDISAELDTYRLAEALDVEAIAAGVMLLPGCGGSVAMLGCLSGHAVERARDPVRIDVALQVSGSMSRGSARSAAGSEPAGLRRTGGILEVQHGAAGATQAFDFDDGRGPASCFVFPLPDLITIWRSTGVANIATFVLATNVSLQGGDESYRSALPDGPTAAELEAHPYHAVAEVTGADGTVHRSVLHTVNGYSFTALASAEAARRVAGGEARAGFQTPALLFGNGFVETIAESSLVRHEVRCANGPTTFLRQKACLTCARSKLRCDLQRPQCGRCERRTLLCEYASPPESSGPLSCPASQQAMPAADLPSTSGSARLPVERPRSERLMPPVGNPRLEISEERRQVLLGTASAMAGPDSTARSTVHFVIRVLLSWPRRMAAYGFGHLPPIIHRLQLESGVPATLASCCTLAKMWADHEEGSRGLVERTVLQEIRRILDQRVSHGEMDLLADAQALVLLLIIALYGFGYASMAPDPRHPQLLVDAWDVKQRLAATGLFLAEEVDGTVPPWRRWAAVSAKRRTVLALQHLEWTWSMLHGYPVLSCFELGALPAPAAGHIWQAAEEQVWKNHYSNWLWQWRHGSYKMAELFRVNSEGRLDDRSEMWLADADEYGVVLMAESESTGKPQLFR
ncbi:saccharopine dehydrogenase [Ophiostoma piceae UAMH 11346]|uniref:Saccharopine dehydrogenase n=1 Tax=Ophiostoma piceae (strain UAMH 11346) TaxID=1262450 RepID=S3CA57_OPHP1|nr:saccharopine dehydrogenase [Ophiostoma piceae UAMH 11346]